MNYKGEILRPPTYTVSGPQPTQGQDNRSKVVSTAQQQGRGRQEHSDTGERNGRDRQRHSYRSCSSVAPLALLTDIQPVKSHMSCMALVLMTSRPSLSKKHIHQRSHSLIESRPAPSLLPPTAESRCMQSQILG